MREATALILISYLDWAVLGLDHVISECNGQDVRIRTRDREFFAEEIDDALYLLA